MKASDLPDPIRHNLADLIGTLEQAIRSAYLYRRPDYPHETQQSITQWADETFGKTENSTAGRRRGLARLVEEIKEFLELCNGMPETINDEYYEALKLEIADIIIVGSRLVGDAVDRKMFINRQRKWRRDGTGHGYHIKG